VAAPRRQTGSRVIVIYNPLAGERKSIRLWRVLDILSGNGVRVRLMETRHRGHATSLAREASAASEPLIVAAGGDGTIAEVANGLNGSGARLGVIPLGTANVLARELNLPIAPREVAAALAFGRTRTLWPGLARTGGEERLFVQMVGVGLDAQVVHRLPAKLKQSLGRAAYVVQTMRELARYGYAPIQLRIDGREEEACSVIVSKGTLYAGQYMLAPDAKPGERGFSIALFGRAGPFSALMYGAALPLNLLPNAPGLRLLRGFCVEFLGEGQPAQADGDPAGEVPITVQDAAHPIEVVTG
jgi:YegS/Rv2252/BmrU family lipid kinase